MTEPEILCPIKCPVCSQESLLSFRISVVADALKTGDIRLYANCHVAGWHASAAELETIREFLDATWSGSLQEACQEFVLDSAWERDSAEYIQSGMVAPRIAPPAGDVQASP
jgi:hypothetical protein